MGLVFLDELGYEPFQEWESGRSWRMVEMYMVLYKGKQGFSTFPIIGDVWVLTI